MRERGQPRPSSFYFLFAIFALYLAFLYGPMLCVFILSFQGPTGGMSFPMVGVSTHWFQVLFAGSGGAGVGDIHDSFIRSMRLAAIVATLTVLIAVAAGMAYRRKFPGSNFVFYSAITSMVLPGIFVGFGIALAFNLMGYQVEWFTSGIGAQLTWSLPFGLLIMFIVLGRFNRSYEEAATDLGATSWQRFREVILPIILPGVIGIFMAGFTSSYEEAARTSLNVGTGNTMPMEITGLLTAATSPVLFAVGTVTTLFSFSLVIGTLLLTMAIARRRRLRIRAH
ncbi:ABC transporter permease [Rhizobium sp. 18055]|jgi:putative spermidine/putrescine transport system permease protein|uniref:ABC transporter permease n=1 Tax=Rhizobium sp. 18055 TaxID=2681403 RepID=UPI00135C614B|nr:ABC transporter permease [Rhizobium sp. 18055]